VDINCQQMCKISRKRLNKGENIPKSFKGASFFSETPCSSFIMSTRNERMNYLINDCDPVITSTL